jgi:RND family efflux transporter MFP subunit
VTGLTRRLSLPLAGVLVAIAFAAGWWLRGGPAPEEARGPQILYYVDPMNPAFRSPEPGIAPCGMPLEPVYAEGTAVGGGALPDGTIRVGADRRQLIGIEVETLARGPVRHTLRLLGRVAPDETRVHVVDTTVSGRVREVGPVTVGSLVRQGERLGGYLSDELVGAQQNLLNAVSLLAGLQGKSDPESQKQAVAQEQLVRSSRRYLVNKGVSEEQIAEIERTRSISTRIEIRAPVSGYLLARDFKLGQWFGPNMPLFVIADLTTVWVLADAFENDARHFPAGGDVVVRIAGRDDVVRGRIGKVPAQFDEESRTLKIRLEVSNPRLALLPGMYVDVEREIVVEDALSLPASALLDTGLRQRVFVEIGEGLFQPREVTTGARLGDRVLLLSGIEPGERVVTSGNFLLDSESRMRTSVPAASVGTSIDPICKMAVDEAAARAAGLVSDLAGQTRFFCSAACKERFEREWRARAEPTAAP